MKARTQMHRSTMKLRSQHNKSIYFTSGERLHRLKFDSLFLKDKTIKPFLSTTPDYTQLLLHELFTLE
jgi:hypothetical protein